MTSIFVDTSALLPLVHRDDHDHSAMVNTLGTLEPSQTTLISSSYVLVEAGSLIRSRFGTSAFRRLGEIMERTVDIVWVDEELHRRAWKEASTGGKRAPGLVDWVSFLLMAELGITTALARDRHFVQQGFKILPNP